MELVSERLENGLMVSVNASRIDAADSIEFKERFRDQVVDWKGRIVLNLSAVEFLDSSGLGAVVTAMKALNADCHMELAGLTPTVEKVFRLTRLDTVFKIHKTADAARLAA